jgi:hypothetical protein
MPLFRNRAVQVRVVKTDNTENTTDPLATAVGESSARLVNELAKDFVKYAAGAVVAGIAVYKIFDTVSQIAVKKTRSADND